MYHIRHRHNSIGEFYDDGAFRTLWREGVTPLKLITMGGIPLVPPYARNKFNFEWRMGIESLHRIGWDR